MTTSRASEATLGAEARELFRHTGPRLIAATVAATTVARFAVGGWGWTDLVVAVVILGFEPFTEWLIHVHVLHARPRRILGFTYDSRLARDHRAHHADPKDRHLVLVPLPTLVVGIPLAAALVVLFVRPIGPGLTGLMVGSGMLMAYEWTHHLIHSAHRPRSRYYRSIWRAHRLHHHRNERYWFGVTVNLADHVLGTFPAKDEVPLSPTARTSGIDVEAGRG